MLEFLYIEGDGHTEREADREREKDRMGQRKAKQ